jgi:hypothetical protein
MNDEKAQSSKETPPSLLRIKVATTSISSDAGMTVNKMLTMQASSAASKFRFSLTARLIHRLSHC